MYLWDSYLYLKKSLLIVKLVLKKFAAVVRNRLPSESMVRSASFFAPWGRNPIFDNMTWAILSPGTQSTPTSPRKFIRTDSYISFFFPFEIGKSRFQLDSSSFLLFSIDADGTAGTGSSTVTFTKRNRGEREVIVAQSWKYPWPTRDIFDYLKIDYSIVEQILHKCIKENDRDQS